MKTIESIDQLYIKLSQQSNIVIKETLGKWSLRGMIVGETPHEIIKITVSAVLDLQEIIGVLFTVYHNFGLLVVIVHFDYVWVSLKLLSNGVLIISVPLTFFVFEWLEDFEALDVILVRLISSTINFWLETFAKLFLSMKNLRPLIHQVRIVGKFGLNICAFLWRWNFENLLIFSQFLRTVISLADLGTTIDKVILSRERNFIFIKFFGLGIFLHIILIWHVVVDK